MKITPTLLRNTKQQIGDAKKLRKKMQARRARLDKEMIAEKKEFGSYGNYRYDLLRNAFFRFDEASDCLETIIEELNNAVGDFHEIAKMEQ